MNGCCNCIQHSCHQSAVNACLFFQSGDHAKVDAWRRKNAIERTCRWRPDLIETARLTPEERAFAQEILDASYSQSEE